MKQVWIFNHYATEPHASGSARHYHLAQYLLTNGWQTSVIAASVDHTSGRQRLGEHERVRLDVYEKVPFLWLRTPRYWGNGSGRIINMLIYASRAVLPVSTRMLSRPDVIIGSSVHPFAALAAAWVAKRHQVPFIFEVRDLWPQTLIDLGRLRDSSIIAYMMRKMERWLYRRAHRIVTLLPRAVDYITPLGISADKVIWISNGVNLSEFPDPGFTPDKNNNPFVLMYFGAHGQANALDVLIRAMAHVRQANPSRSVCLRLIGNGPVKPALQKLAAELGLNDDWISFEPPVLKRDIPGLASEADGFVITVRDAPRLYKYGISMNKLFDYLAGRRPIIIASAAINNPVIEAGCGIAVAPDDPEALAEGIIKLINLPLAERMVMGERGRRHVEAHYSYASLAARLAEILNQASP